MTTVEEQQSTIDGLVTMDGELQSAVDGLLTMDGELQSAVDGLVLVDEAQQQLIEGQDTLIDDLDLQVTNLDGDVVA